ncbi:MAG TPA: autotransporter-associated beta strand repeat-containing protein [Tepidisphaeraceae bacterium]|nr:autotransporter-associated beta strand repeat-containing protein [Tepidisphaeraceae bacterium]
MSRQSARTGRTGIGVARRIGLTRSRQGRWAETLEARRLLSAAADAIAPQWAATPWTPPATQAAGPAAPSATSSIPLSASAWTPIGPASISHGQVPGNGLVSGRLAGVAGDPTNASVLYVAAAGGGVWKTVDGGASWTPLTDNQSTLFMGAIAVAKSNPNVIYAGTGEATNSFLSYYGRGVLKSTDGGTTWSLMGNSVFDRHTISQIAVDPTNANNLYVAVGGGGVNGVGGNTGVWKSTDGGGTWVNTTTSISSGAQFSDVEMDPTNPQRLFCAVNSGSLSGVYQTTNGATSWTLVAGGLPSGSSVGNPRVAISASNPQVVYASFDNPSNSNAAGIWKSTDGGATWAQPGTVPNYMGGQGWYDTTLIVDPTNSNIAYAGGQTSFIQTTDGGAHWTDISTGATGNNGPHADHHAIGFDANGHLLDGDDGGVWRLDNATPGSILWTDLNSNLQITQFIGGDISPTDPNAALGGSQDNGTEQFSGNSVWTLREGGDGGTVRIDKQNPSIVYHEAPIESFGATNFFRRSADGGQTWTAAVNGINALDPQNFYPPFAVDPTNGSHLVFGTNRVYETTNQGTNWAPISTPNTNGWTTSGNLDALAFSPSSPGTIYASAGGHLFVTTNDGAAWTQHDATGVNGSYAQILVDPSNAQTVYVVTSAFGLPHVLRSIDGGATWQNLSGNLPNLPTWSIALNPAQGAIYVGNDNGVWVTTNDGTSWSTYQSGMPNVQVRDLEFNSSLSILSAFTHGRGAWEISTTVSTPLVVNTLDDETTPGDGLLSLREAVALANGNGDSIGFDPSLAGGVISLNAANGPLDITASYSIVGPQSGGITISSSGAGGQIEVSSGASTTLSNLALIGRTILQVDSGGTASLQNATISGSVLDNGALTTYQFIAGTDSGSISGTGTFAKGGPATLTLTGINTYSGGTTVSGGTLTGNTNSLQGSITVTAAATLAFDQSSLAGTTAGTFAGNISGAGTVHILGPASTVTLNTGATLTNSGPTVIDSGAALVAATTNDLSATSGFIVNGTLNLNGFDQSIGSLAGAASGLVYTGASASPSNTLTAGNNNTSTTYSGLLEDVPSGSTATTRLALKKIGPGTLTLVRPTTGPNTYTGGTVVLAGSLLGNTASVNGQITDGSAVSLDQTLGGVNDGTLSGAIAGAGTLTIANGTLRLAPGTVLQNSGQTMVNGTLIGPATGGAGAFSASSVYVVNGTLDLGGSDQTIGSLSGSGTVYHAQPSGQPALATLTVGGTNAASTFIGILEDAPASTSGMLAITKVGTGTFTITGADTYSGGTNLNGGTIDVGPSTADPMGTGTVNLNGGTLSLQGRFGTATQQIVPTTGYNQDVIVEASATDPVAGTSIPFDGTGGGDNNVWYEKGFVGTAANGTGLPTSGSVFTSAANSAVQFQLQPYNANNVALINGANGSVTLQLATPASFASLNFLAASANGGANVTATLNFTDGTNAIDQLSISDWFNGNNAAVTAGGRIARTTTATVSLTSGNPRLYEYDYALIPANEGKLLSSITFKETSGNQVGIYGLSGAVLSLPLAQSYPNAVNVLANSVIDVRNSPQASLGNLSIGSNQLTLTGQTNASLAFGPVSLGGNATFVPSAGTTLSLGVISGPGNSIAQAGAGTMKLTAVDTYATTTVNAGTLIAGAPGAIPTNSSLAIASGATVQITTGSPAFTTQLSSLSIASTGRLDLTNNGLEVAYAPGSDPVSTVRAYITSGELFSSLSDANHTLGYADSADNVVQGLAANTIAVKYTIFGDTNLDGTVNLADFLNLSRHFGTSAGWDAGDFNYDGTVNLADLLTLTRHFGQQLISIAPTVTTAISSPPPAPTARRRALPA